MKNRPRVAYEGAPLSNWSGGRPKTIRARFRSRPAIQGVLRLKLDHHQPITFEQPFGRLECFDSVNVIINPNIRIIGTVRYANRELKHNEVEALTAVLDIAARVIHYNVYVG